MSKALTVKVPTVKVIKALETKLVTITNDYNNQELNEAKFQKEFASYEKSLKDFAIANIKKATNIRTNYRAWHNTLNIDYDIIVEKEDLPVIPERKFEVIREHEYKETVQEITNALNILRMTDEPVVNASTMKSIAKYL